MADITNTLAISLSDKRVKLLMDTILGVSIDIETTFSTNGSARRSKHPSYNIWEKESSARLLSILAEIKNSPN